MATCACRITIAELVAALDYVQPEAVLGLVGDDLDRDWQGNPAVRIEVAARIVSERRGSVREQTAMNEMYRGWLDDRAFRREEAAREAAEAARAAFLTRRKPIFAFTGPGGGSGPIVLTAEEGLGDVDREQLADRIREASEQARIRFDAKEPELDRPGWERTFAKEMKR